MAARRIATLAVVLAALALLVALAACAPSGPQAVAPQTPAGQPPGGGLTRAPTAMKLRLDWKPGAQHAAFYLAKDRGYYAKEGIDLEIIPGSGSADSVKFLGTNTVDVALVDGLVLVQARAQEVPLQSIAVYYQRTPISIISPQAHPIKTPQDLIGKKVGSKKGSATYQGLQVFLAANHIPQEQLQLVDVGFGVQPLLVGQVDALMGFTMNERVDAELGGMPVTEMLISDYGVHAYGLTIAASAKVVQGQGDVLKGFLRATKQGMQDAAKEGAAAVEAVAKAVPDINRDHELKVMERTVPVWSSEDTKTRGYGWQTEEGWKQTLDTTTSLKLVEKAPAVKDLFTNAFLQ